MICDDVITAELKFMYMSAKPCPVCLTTMGSLASRGSRPRTWFTFDSASAIARSGLASSLRLSVTVDTFCCELDTSVSMPSVLATACSIGVVMKPLMTSAAAPG